MANWSNPTLTSLYTDFVTEVKNRDVDLALGLDPATTSPTNVPTGAIRWNSASYKYEKWSGSAWGDLSTKYIFTAVEVSGATVPANGMYLSTTNTLNFSTATTASRLTIDGSGNVNIDAGTFYVDAVNNRVGVGTTNLTTTFTTYGGNVGLELDTSIGFSNRANTGTLRAYDRVGSAYRDLGITGANILFGISDTEKARVDSSGTFRVRGSTSNTPGTNDAVQFNGSAPANSVILDSSGNLGLGVVPSAWGGGYTGMQLNSGLSLMGSNVNGNFVANAYFDGTNWKYKQSGIYSNNFYVNYGNNGSFVWSLAPSGTAGNAITFTQAMTLDASGRLGIGTVNPTEALTIGSGSNDRIGASVSGTIATIFLGNSNSATSCSSISYNRSDGGLSFNNGATGSITERARIDSSGYMQGTVNGLSAGRIPAKQYYRLDSAYAGTNGTAAQAIYGVGVTLVGSTVYEFEAIYAFSRGSGSTSHYMSFLFGGTATVNNIFYTGVGPGESGVPPLSTYDGAPASFVASSATAAQATTTITGSIGIFYIVKGTVSINAGGTFIPQYQLSAAPGAAYSTYAGAYFSIWPLGASGANTSIGSWA